VILHRPFSHPFPNTGSRSRSIARSDAVDLIARVMRNTTAEDERWAHVGRSVDFGSAHIQPVFNLKGNVMNRTEFRTGVTSILE
jgi:hypothetical protein